MSDVDANPTPPTGPGAPIPDWDSPAPQPNVSTDHLDFGPAKTIPIFDQAPPIPVSPVVIDDGAATHALPANEMDAETVTVDLTSPHTADLATVSLADQTATLDLSVQAAQAAAGNAAPPAPKPQGPRVFVPQMPHRTLDQNFDSQGPKIGMISVETSTFLGKGSFGVIYPGTATVEGSQEPIPIVAKYMKVDNKSATYPLEVAGAQSINAVLDQHPDAGVCRTYGDAWEFASQGAYAAMVMDRAPGVSLDEHARGSAMPAAEVQQVALKLSKTLATMHGCQSTIHNDIKPNNIFYDAQSGQVTIIDYGSTANAQNLIHRNVASTTPPYCDFKSIHDSLPLQEYQDGKNDVHMLGMTMLHLSKGETPLAKWNKDFKGYIENMTHMDPDQYRDATNEMIRRFEEELPKEIAGIADEHTRLLIAHAVNPSRAQRPTSAEYTKLLTLPPVALADRSRNDPWMAQFLTRPTGEVTL